MKIAKRIRVIILFVFILATLFSVIVTASAESVIYCSNCGEKINANSKFCMFCGNEIVLYVQHTEEMSPEELNKYANAFYNGDGVEKNYEKAFSYWEKSAGLGNMEAQFHVGFCYYFGYGTEQNYKKSAEWFVKAADQGEQGAQYNLGVMYENGIGVEQDYEKAVGYYQASAKQGNEFAQCNLAYCYINGLGVEKSETLAIHWYEIAASQGNELAINSLKDLVIISGDSVNSNGLFSVFADKMGNMLIDTMNSSKFLEKLPFDPLFSYWKSNDEYIICYDNLSLQRITMLKNDSRVDGNSEFDTLVIECPCYVREDILCMTNSCVAAIFLSSPSSTFDEALTFYQQLIVAASETDDGEYSHATLQKDKLTYAVEAYLINKDEDSWYYYFMVTGE